MPLCRGKEGLKDVVGMYGCRWRRIEGIYPSNKIVTKPKMFDREN